MQKFIDIKRINKFLADECDYKEAEEIAAYLKEHIDVLDSLNVFDDLDQERISIISPAIKQKVFNNIVDSNRSTFRFKKLLVAVCLIGSILGLFFIYNNNNRTENILITENINIPASKKIVNEGMDKMQVLLPDGSKLILNSMAAISYQNDFKNIRNIVVDSGNVYFMVAKQPEKPFSVFANGIKTTALGTEFWIENDMTIHSVKVKLKEGKVAVVSVDNRFTMDSVFLNPAQECWIDKRTGYVKVIEQKAKKEDLTTTRKNEKTEEPEDEVLWTNNNLQLSKAKLYNVLRKLENRYNVTIVVDEKNINRATLTGRILYSDSLDLIIKSICEINNLGYEKRNDTIFLSK